MLCTKGRPIPVLFAFLLTLPVAAAPDPSRLCEAASDAAAIEEGIPRDILRALTLTETGRAVGSTLRPWPWAVNQGGESFWFDSEAAAVAHAEAQIAAGVRNLDIGCFQLNVRWHGENFPDAGTMFDPEANARHAANFLSGLHDETGDWLAAAAAYHSRTEAPARRYRARFEAILAGLSGPSPAFATHGDARLSDAGLSDAGLSDGGPSDGGPPGAAPTEAALRVSQDAPRPNHFPLLQVGRRGNGGSLVPRSAARTPLIGG